MLGVNSTLKDKIFLVQKNEIPILIEKLVMNVNSIHKSKKENFTIKRGRGRPKKYVTTHISINTWRFSYSRVKLENSFHKINTINHYFKNGFKNQKTICTTKNNIVQNNFISNLTIKKSSNEDDENLLREYLNEASTNGYNSGVILDDEDEEFSGSSNFDKPSKIIDFNEINGVQCFQVVWEMRSNGIFPKNSYVINNHFKDKFPTFPLIF